MKQVVQATSGGGVRVVDVPVPVIGPTEVLARTVGAPGSVEVAVPAQNRVDAHLLVVAGARPNFMKVKPVLDALDAAGARTTLVHTGQHYDPSMSDVFFDELGLRAPAFRLSVGSASHARQTAAVLCAFEPVVEQTSPDAVVVVGDVNSTLACALTSVKLGVRTAHVEAGLRSGDRTMPEEINRLVVDRICDDLMAPSPDAVDNLLAEGCPPASVHLVGNVMVDTLLACRNRAEARLPDLLGQLGLRPGEYGLVTVHRPSNVDDDAVLTDLLGTLGAVARRLPLLFPVHPRTAARLAGRAPDGLRLLPPAAYLDFVALQLAARVVLTDSGGVQEETTALGVPCLTLRDTTERPVTVVEGTNRVVGRRRADVLAAVDDVFTRPPAPRRPAIWDGRAGQRIAAVLLGAGGDSPRREDRACVSS